MIFRRGVAVLASCFALVLPQLADAAAPGPRASSVRWIASWATALQPIPELASPPPLYKVPDVAGRTLREIVYPTLSGQAIRLRVSNAYGAAPLVVDAMQIGRSAGGAAVSAGSSMPITFNGRRAIVVPPGQERDSDPIVYRVSAGEPYAISMHLGPSQKMTVWHRVANQVNYVSTPGDHSGDAGAAAYRVRVTHSAWISELAVAAPTQRALAVAAVGDSITDGLRSSLDRNRRWPDALARRLVQTGDESVGVVNLGISGNRLLSDSPCYGVALEKRFGRDVLARSGVKAAVLLIGINDINFAAMPLRAGLDCDAPHTTVSAAMLIEGYRRLIEAARRQGIALFGATLTPAGLPPEREAIRRAVNDWIRTSGAFAGVIDFDAALRDPARPTHLLHRYDSGDGIHPNDDGYAAMAAAVPLERLVAAARRR